LAKESTCYLKAATDASVEVYDLNRDGDQNVGAP
jgi:hypothetical protein